MKITINDTSSKLAASLINGLVFTPIIYAFIGANLGFSLHFNLIFVPLTALSIFVLSKYYILQPKSKSKKSKLLEILSLIAIAFYLYIISNFNLMTGTEKLGFFSLIYLISFSIFLFISFFRDYEIEKRLRKYQKINFTISVTLIILLLIFSSIYLLSEHYFMSR